MPLRACLRVVALVIPLLTALPATALDDRVLAHPRAHGDGAHVALVVERPGPAANLPATYVVVLRPIGGETVPIAALFIGVGAIVDDIRLGAASVDIAYRDHWPVDTPGQPTRQKIRAFALHADWLQPSWASPDWAKAADLR